MLAPLADGGDGTLEVLMKSMKGRLVSTKVRGPLGKSVRASWALCPNKTAVIEMARASGLALVGGKNRIRKASSFGTGQLIKAALDRGCRTIYVGVGGTATSDGGAAALEALGLSYFGRVGQKISGAPKDLIDLKQIDWRRLDPRLKTARIHVLCDVTNPLLGPRGSARTFGPQKGASAADVIFLERTLKKWATFAKYQTKNNPGAGAAGAVAFGLSGFFGARLVRGTPFVMEKINWKKSAREANVIITGEGKIDKTSFSGKVIGAIARHPAKVLVLCGDSPLGTVYLRRHGIAHIERLGKRGLRVPERALREAAGRLCAFLSSSNPART